MIVINIICCCIMAFALVIIGFLVFKLKSKNDYIYGIESIYQKNIYSIEKRCENDIKQLRNTNAIEKNKLLDKIDYTEKLLIDQKNQNGLLQKKISSTKCIICATPSNGKHFCLSCYTKLKERSIDVRITNCSETKILDYFGNLQYKCADGRMVRSRAEARISDCLYNNKIRYIYEKPIYYIENGTNKTLYPDFYLPDYNVYIEYNELTTEDYLRKKAYAMQIYKQKGLNVITMSGKDVFDIENFIIPKLNSLRGNTNV